MTIKPPTATMPQRNISPERQGTYYFGMLKDTLDEAGVDLSGESKDMPFDEQLRRLDALKRDGLVTEAEYAEAKAKILQGIGQ